MTEYETRLAVSERREKEIKQIGIKLFRRKRRKGG